MVLTAVPILTMLDYAFMQHAFISGTLIAVLAGIVGYFVVLRHLTFASHALAHIGFAGATGAVLIGYTPIIGQLAITILAALSMGIAGDRLSRSDVAVGVILAFSLGLGALFLHLHNGYAGQANIILFGNLLGVSEQAIKLMAVLVVICLIVLAIVSRPLLFTSLEPELAEAKGVPLTKLSIAIFIIMAIAVSLASQVVGIMLVFTLLIGPAAIAMQWTKSFWRGLLVSLLISLTVVWLSLVLAYMTDWPVSFWVSLLVLVGYLARPIAVKVYG